MLEVLNPLSHRRRNAIDTHRADPPSLWRLAHHRHGATLNRNHSGIPPQHKNDDPAHETRDRADYAPPRHVHIELND